MLNAIAAFILLIVVLAAFNIKNDAIDSKSPKTTPHTVTLPPPPNPRILVTISDLKWGKSGFGSVGLGYFTVRNENSFAVKDIAIQCDFYANSGTHLTSANATIYEAIGAKKSRTFNEVNLGFIHSQSNRIGCQIISVQRAG
jgi:hypothetical protein